MSVDQDFNDLEMSVDQDFNDLERSVDQDFNDLESVDDQDFINLNSDDLNNEYEPDSNDIPKTFDGTKFNCKYPFGFFNNFTNVAMFIWATKYMICKYLKKNIDLVKLNLNNLYFFSNCSLSRLNTNFTSS